MERHGQERKEPRTADLGHKSGGESLAGVRLVIDLEAPIYVPTVAQVVHAVRRLETPPPSQLTLERLGGQDPPYLHCVRTVNHGWFLTRRDESYEEVFQAGQCTTRSALDYALSWAQGSKGSEPDLPFRPAGNGRIPDIDWSPVKWVHSPWQSEGTDSYYEINHDGIVLREARLKNHQTVPCSASSLADWIETQRGLYQPMTPSSLRNELRFGRVPEGTEDSWGDYPHTEITRDKFNAVWEEARRHLTHHLRDDTRW